MFRGLGTNLFLVIFIAFVGMSSVSFAKYIDCKSLLSSTLNTSKWQREIDLGELAQTFVGLDTSGNSIVDWNKFEKFKLRQPGTWISITDGNGGLKNVRVLLLKSVVANPKGLKVFLGGIGYDIERFLARDKVFIENILKESHLAMVEKGGLTDLEAYLKLVEKNHSIPNDLHPGDESRDLALAIQQVQILMRAKGIETGDKVDVVALSAGGWIAQFMAAENLYNKEMRSLIMMDPGAQSLDEHFIPIIGTQRNLLELFSYFKNPVASSLNRWSKAMYFNSADNSMKNMFEALRKDSVRRKFATARVTGLSSVNGLDMIRKISPTIEVSLFIGGRDDIVPPSLFVEIVKALESRNFINGGRAKYRVVYMPAVEHDSPASTDPQVAEMISKISDGNLDHGIWMVDGKTVVQTSPDKLIVLLKSHEKEWMDTQKARFRELIFQK